MPTYKVRRFFQDSKRETVTIKTGLTLEEAQAHCRDPETNSRTCTSMESQGVTRANGPWFDGYDAE